MLSVELASNTLKVSVVNGEVVHSPALISIATSKKKNLDTNLGADRTRAAVPWAVAKGWQRLLARLFDFAINLYPSIRLLGQAQASLVVHDLVSSELCGTLPFRVSPDDR